MSGVTKIQAQEWLDKQGIYQIYKPRPAKITGLVIYDGIYDVRKPNDTHQADILYLPHDGVKQGRKTITYKYVLTVIDAASRYKEAEPLKTKTATEVCQAIKKIYERNPLKYPRLMMVDSGHEFMSCFIKLMKEHDVKIYRAKPGDKLKVAFVERFNRTLSERLFRHIYNEEMKTREVNREWFKRLPEVVEALNNEVTRLIDKKLVDAIELDEVVSENKYII